MSANNATQQTGTLVSSEEATTPAPADIQKRSPDATTPPIPKEIIERYSWKKE